MSSQRDRESILFIANGFYTGGKANSFFEGIPVCGDINFIIIFLQLTEKPTIAAPIL
jgi:hypothetical protein